MKTVGEILKEARSKKQISLENIASRTKINLSYLHAIEQNDFSKLPPSAFTKGFMQNYAKIVGLNPKTVLAIFRRDYDQDEKGRIIPRSLSDPVKTPKIPFNPTTTSIIISLIVSILIATFFIRQVIVFRAAPNISLSEPQEESQVTSPVFIQGNTQPEATITINNQTISVTEDGSFTAEFELSPGEHTLVVTATSRNNKQRTLQRIINVVE